MGQDGVYDDGVMGMASNILDPDSVPPVLDPQPIMVALLLLVVLPVLLLSAVDDESAM